jgi:putative ABC transport system ATP-binding protein
MNNPMMENINRKQVTGNLDSMHGEEVMEMLSKLNEAGTTIIMVTHSPAYAEYGNRVAHLFDEHIVTENMKGKFHV